MKISDLIKVLQECMRKHGDRAIVTDFDFEWLDNIFENGDTLYLEAFNEERKEI